MKEISTNFELKTKDLIELHYRILSVFENVQIDYLINNISQDGRMIVEDYQLERSNWYSDILKIRIRIIDNPFPLALIVATIGAIATSIFVYLSFQKAYLISREAPEVLSAGVSTFAIGLVIVGAFLLLK